MLKSVINFLIGRKPEEKVLIGVAHLWIEWTDKDNKRELTVCYLYKQGNDKWYELDSSSGQITRSAYGSNGKGLGHSWLALYANAWVRGHLSDEDIQNLAKQTLGNIKPRKTELRVVK